MYAKTAIYNLELRSSSYLAASTAIIIGKHAPLWSSPWRAVKQATYALVV